MNRPSPFGNPLPFGGSRPFDGSSLLDRFHGKPVGEVRFPTAAAPPRQAVDPDYLRKVRENDPWPEGSSCAPPSPKPLVPPVAVTLSNCRFLTPVDHLRFNESFEMAVDVRRSAPGKTRRAFFTLHYEMHHEGKTERGTAFQGTEGFPDSDRELHTVTAKGFLFIMAPLRTGATIDFWLTATHQEASGPVESPKVNVPLLRHAHWMGGTDILFGLGSSFPRLGPDGRLAAVLAAALQRGAKPADPKIPESAVCFGFASASGSPESNRKLSRRRAEAVKAILDRNHDAWHDLARNHFGTHDIQAFLADLDTLEHLGCTPGPVDGGDGPRTRAAIEAFQRHANGRWRLGLAEDGLCGPATWGAVLRALVACVQSKLGQDPSQEPAWKPMPWGRNGEGVYANGEDFASEQENPDERSVQIAFFAQGSEPRMEDHKGPTKATRRQNPTQDPAQVRKQRIVQIGLAPSEAEATADPSGTSAATTESPPPSADTADDSPASTSAASSDALSDLKIKFLSESGYCGDTIQIQVDGEQDSINRAVKIQITSGNNSAALESIPATLGTVPYKAKWIAKKPGPDWPGSEIKISAESGASSYAGDNHFHFKRIPDCREELKTIACSSVSSNGNFAWTGRYHIGFRSGILHITTRIKLINRLGAKPTGGGSPPPIGPPVTAAEKASMKTDIESKLTAKWFMHRVKCGRDKRCDCDEKNGCCKFRVRVHVEFVESGEDHVVDLFQGTGRASSRKWTRVKTRPNSWAHETGHLLGWYDEYSSGAVGAAPRWKVANPDAVMGSGLRVPFTYYWDFRDWLKAKTSQEWEGVD